jgi:hypothetical protein
MRDLTSYDIAQIAGGMLFMPAVISIFPTIDLDAGAPLAYASGESGGLSNTAHLASRTLGALSEGITLAQHPVFGAGMAFLLCAAETFYHDNFHALISRSPSSTDELR